MAVQDQWKTVKNNWLIIVLLIVLVGFPYFAERGNSLFGLNTQSFNERAMGTANYDSGMMKYEIMPNPFSGDLAPPVEDRKITKTSSLSTEVERETFQNTEQKLKNIVSSSNSFLLNENVNKYGQGRKSYFSGIYNLKVNVRKYDAVLSQLKQIGEVQSFSENTQDITGTYTNIQTELEAERARLERYNQMLAEATTVADKIELNDRIFNQERTVKYLEDSLKNQDEQVEYATIYVQMAEKQSEFAGLAFITFGQLVRGLVSSTSNLLELLFSILPWIIVIIIVWLAVRWRKRKK